MRVLYICYVDFKNKDSANRVRPHKIYEAFLSNNCDVKLLAEAQTQVNKVKRKKAVNDVLLWLKYNKPDFCYIESDTTAIRLSCDYKLLKLIHKLKIPTAYFYRDFYHKFKDMRAVSNSLFDKLREIYIDYLWYKTDKAISKMDIVYFPSKECTAYFNFNKMFNLPPAGEILPYQHRNNGKTCIYVGGLSQRYGTDILMNSFIELNKGKDIYTLILICREDEFNTNYSHFAEYSWLKVYNTQGDKLSNYYKISNVALLPLENTEYNSFAISVKLFEYMSYGLPIVTTCNAAMAQIVVDCKCGLVCKDNYISFANAIKEILNNDDELNSYSNNALNAIREKHNWTSRIKKISNNLLNNGGNDYD